eukprot:CAMPEP_0172802904 /NCGR_PEP_ID=MMETSP1075-20121228/4157_1 /TAXON_ID=2916 /ORGANISM="Ceratium fusus, Strain PA161109" /LENGTH=196 /DNA_ID=CAMNT_0013641235 /DNA_START=10 /DNA_END=597 /DNA_ORIENTATION=-
MRKLTNSDDAAGLTAASMPADDGITARTDVGCDKSSGPWHFGEDAKQDPWHLGQGDPWSRQGATGNKLAVDSSAMVEDSTTQMWSQWTLQLQQARNAAQSVLGASKGSISSNSSCYLDEVVCGEYVQTDGAVSNGCIQVDTQRANKHVAACGRCNDGWKSRFTRCSHCSAASVVHADPTSSQKLQPPEIAHACNET